MRGGKFLIGRGAGGFLTGTPRGVIWLCRVASGGWRSSRGGGRRARRGYMGRGGIHQFGHVLLSTAGSGGSCQSICRSWWGRSRAFPIALIEMSFDRMRRRREIVVQAWLFCLVDYSSVFSLVGGSVMIGLPKNRA